MMGHTQKTNSKELEKSERVLGVMASLGQLHAADGNLCEGERKTLPLA